MSPTFIAVLKDGKTVYSHSLANITSTPYNYLFKVESNGYVLTFTPISSNGQLSRMTVANFELVHIGEDIKSKQGFIGRLVTVKEIKTGLNRQETFTTDGLDFITKDLLPFFKKLYELGSWEMYQKSKKFDLIKEENRRLKEQVAEKEKELSTLKEKLMKVKSLLSF